MRTRRSCRARTMRMSETGRGVPCSTAASLSANFQVIARPALFALALAMCLQVAPGAAAASSVLHLNAGAESTNTGAPAPTEAGRSAIPESPPVKLYRSMAAAQQAGINPLAPEHEAPVPRVVRKQEIRHPVPAWVWWSACGLGLGVLLAAAKVLGRRRV